MPGFHLKDLLFWSTIAFALTGLESASFMGEEIREPRRTIPRAIFASAPLIVLLYILGTASVLAALPAGQVSGLYGVMEAIVTAAHRLGLDSLSPLAAFFITLTALSSVGAWLGSTARLPFVAGLDHFLPRSFARIHPRWHTPHVSLLVMAGIEAICIVLSQAGTTVKGAYDILVSMTVISLLIPFLLLFTAAIRAQRQPAGPDVLRVPGGRRVAVVLGVVGFLTTAVTIVLSVFPPEYEPHKGIAVAKVLGLTILNVGGGMLVYWMGRRRQRACAPA